MASDDTEITLGVGKLLGLFFLLAAICGVFFSIGYSLGKSTGREQALNDQAANAAVASAAPNSVDEKPTTTVAKPGSDAVGQEPATSPKSSADLTFYKAVKQNDDGPSPATTEAKIKDSAVKETASAKKTKLATVASDSASAAAEVRHYPVTGPGTFVVQIAALSREDDAVALAGALRKKSYNVFVVNNPTTNDKLYHVQVGPFASLQDAEAMKLRLSGEGYSPIVKR